MEKNKSINTHLDALNEEIKKLNSLLNRLYSRQSFARSFTVGLLSGFGSAIGATVIFGLVVYLLSNINLVPVIGDWLGAIMEQAFSNLTF